MRSGRRTDLVVKRSELDILGERGPMRGGPGSLSRVRRVSSIVSLGLTVTRHARHGTRHTAHGIAIYGKAVSRSRDCIKRSVSNFFLCDTSLYCENTPPLTPSPTCRARYALLSRVVQNVLQMREDVQQLAGLRSARGLHVALVLLSEVGLVVVRRVRGQVRVVARRGRRDDLGAARVPG